MQEDALISLGDPQNVTHVGRSQSFMISQGDDRALALRQVGDGSLQSRYGLTCQEQILRMESISVPLREVDRAVVDDRAEGFVRVHHARGRLRGCTIVAPHAGEMIAEVVYAMTHGGTLSTLSSTIYPYPTQAEALRKAGTRIAGRG